MKNDVTTRGVTPDCLGITSRRQSQLISALFFKRIPSVQGRRINVAMVISSPPRTVHPLLMADWVHCNLCFVQPGKGIPFNITSCGHIYCEKCVIKGSKDNCKMCASKCTYKELSGNLKPDVEMYFQDPFDQLNKAFKRCMQVIEFQRNHRRRFFAHLVSTIQEQKNTLMDAKKMVYTMQALERETIKIREENIYLKKLLQEKGFGSSSSRSSSRSGYSPTNYRNSPNSPGMRHSGHVHSNHGPSHSPYYSFHGDTKGSSQLSASQTQHSKGKPLSITPGRIIARTPPSGGKMGVVGGRNSSPAERIISLNRRTPQ